MKILDIPQAGKQGLNVSMGGRYGQVRRGLVIPTNPRSEAQLNVRNAFGNIAARWRTLTEAQRLAWIAAASAHQTRATVGQSGAMTGSQLFNKINNVLALLGAEQVDAPPSSPQWPDNPTDGLTITNLAGVIALKVSCPGTPANNTMVRASKPVSQGRSVCNDFRVVGVLPAPVAGSCDITALYTARFGTPAVGSKVFVKINQVIDGWEDIGKEFIAIVPATA
jgi:hypothetical protein